MLQLIDSMSKLKFHELMDVYVEGNLENGQELYPSCSENEQLMRAEQDFYQYLNSVFFRQEKSVYALWVHEGRYVSALRLEPYVDGLLLSALETAPNSRGKGYAYLLISSVLEVLSKKQRGCIYSHVSKNNKASLGVHRKCGFQILKDHAVYSDGSVHTNAYTLAIKY